MRTEGRTVPARVPDLFSTVRLASVIMLGDAVFSKKPISRILAGTLFTIGGICLTLVSLLAAPSFWYIPCVCALIPLGFAWWLCPPSLAAALSVGPLAAVAALLPHLSGIWFGILAACLVAAILFVIDALGDGRNWKLPLLISLAYLASAFCTDRLFTNNVSVRTFQMGVALDGNAPWGRVSPEWQDGTLPLVLYRKVGASYCYTAFESQELRDRLAQRGETVTVEYNVFSDFGHERSYNVRSVDGILLQNERHIVKDAERFGGQVLTDGTQAPNCW
jgi:hypothetical protein